MSDLNSQSFEASTDDEAKTIAKTLVDDHSSFLYCADDERSSIAYYLNRHEFTDWQEWHNAHCCFFSATLTPELDPLSLVYR